METFFPVLIALTSFTVAVFSFVNNALGILCASLAVCIFTIALTIYQQKRKPKTTTPLEKADFDDRMDKSDEKVSEKIDNKIDKLNEDCIERLYDYHDVVAEKEKLKKEKKDLETRLEKRGQRDEIYKQAKEKVAVCDWYSAEELLKKVYEKDTKAYEKITKEKAEDAFELGKVNFFKPDYKKARKYYEEAVKLAPLNALYLNDLGELLYHTADYEESLKYSGRALIINKKNLSEDHPEVAANLNNIGSAWYSLGEYEKAIEYLEIALEIDNNAFGDQHPSVARELNNIGMAWDSLGEHKKAIEYFEKAFAIDTKAFGEQHPDVAINLNNIGSAWYSLGEYEKAVIYYEKALKIFEDKLGPDHPHTKTVRNNMEMVKALLAKSD